jgi:kynurenine formamidase
VGPSGHDVLTATVNELSDLSAPHIDETTLGSAATDFRAVGERVRNWGRWGDSDERGTLNLITSDELIAAATLVQTGKVFDLGIPFDERGPQSGSGRTNPVRTMRSIGHESSSKGALRVADDVVFMPLQCATQWDALAHVHYDGLLYNGFSAADELSSKGATRCSIDKLAPAITGRAVLLDIAGHRGVDWLGESDAIRRDDLDAAARSQGVDVHRGDILLIRTGWRRNLVEVGDRRRWSSREPGITLDCVEWLHDHEIAVVAADNWGVEQFPSEVASEILPVHMVLLRDMGMTLGEMFDFEALTADCRADGRWDCFFSGPIIKFTRAVGCPVSPLAMK